MLYLSLKFNKLMDGLIIGLLALIIASILYVFYLEKYSFDEFWGVIFNILWFWFLLMAVLSTVLIVIFRMLEISLGIEVPYNSFDFQLIYASLCLLIILIVNRILKK